MTDAGARVARISPAALISFIAALRAVLDRLAAELQIAPLLG